MKLIASILAVAVISTGIAGQQKTPPPPGPERPLNLPKLTEKKLDEEVLAAIKASRASLTTNMRALNANGLVRRLRQRGW